MRTRNLQEAGVIEKANVFSDLYNKNLEEVTLEMLVEKLEEELEKIDITRERIKSMKNELKKSNVFIETENDLNLAKQKAEEILERTINRLEKEIPFERTNELRKDFDGDGLSNLEELKDGTNPFNRDTDYNGISDLEEKHLSEEEKEKE